MKLAPEILSAALTGLETRRARVLDLIAAVRRDLGHKRRTQLKHSQHRSAAPAAAEAPRRRRRITAANRAKIRAAILKRWALWRAGKGPRPGAKASDKR